MAATGVDRRPDSLKAKASSICIKRGRRRHGCGPPRLKRRPCRVAFIEFTAQTRMSGFDLADGRRIRKAHRTR